MIHLIVQASKYLMIFLFLVYTFECFHVFKFEGEEEEQKHIYHVQRTLSEHIICFTSMHPSWFSIICVCYLRLDLLS